MTKAGFNIRPGVHPIVPIMFGEFPNDAKLAQDFAKDLLAGIQELYERQLWHNDLHDENILVTTISTAASNC